MSRRKRSGEIAGGHDSFLDIVANLVGILIILVVILGARSHQVAMQVQADNVAEASLEFAKQETMTFNSVSGDVDQLEDSIQAYDSELALRRKERSALMQLHEIAKEKWQETLQSMDDEDRRIAELERSRQETESELENISAELSSWNAKPDEVVAVEHLPTPMAKTVFGDEIHFRLKDGLVVLVPIEELLDEVKEDFQRFASSRSGARNSAVGPIRDFVARYNMHFTKQVVSRGGQIGTVGRVQVAELLIEPLKEPIGEPITEALAENSQLSFELAGRNPSNTTVTVWVYPESFVEFRQLKEYLYKRGFATAGRPMPKNHPIAASPGGSRSQSQ